MFTLGSGHKIPHFPTEAVMSCEGKKVTIGFPTWFIMPSISFLSESPKPIALHCAIIQGFPTEASN